MRMLEKEEKRKLKNRKEKKRKDSTIKENKQI